jgi:glycerol-3-phosphate dehydrogenase
MGSTDIRIDDPETARCDEAEIAYMLATLRGIFPNIEIRREQIAYTFCGVRPLPASEEGYTSKVSRGHSIRVIEPDTTPPSPSGLEPSASGIRHSAFGIRPRPFPIFNLIGGKWTTFRAFAEQAADRILPRLGLPRRSSTEHTRIGGGRDFPEGPERRKQWIDRVAAESGLARQRVATLLDRYGTDAEAYASSLLVPTLPRGDDSTGRSGVRLSRSETPLQARPDYTVGEIERIARTEQVVHLTDLVCRRSTIALLGRAAPQALRELAEIAGAILGWDQARQEAEINSARADATPPRPR